MQEECVNESAYTSAENNKTLTSALSMFVYA